MPKLTARAARVYEFILAFKAEHDGCAPTIREIGDAVAISSTSVVNYHLDRLVKEGLITRGETDGAFRMITVIGAEWIAPMAESPAVSNAHWISTEI